MAGKPVEAPDDVLLVRSALTRSIAENKRLRHHECDSGERTPLAPPARTRDAVRPGQARQGGVRRGGTATPGATRNSAGHADLQQRMVPAHPRLLQKCVHLTDIRRAGAKISEVHLALGNDIIEGETIFPTSRT